MYVFPGTLPTLFWCFHFSPLFLSFTAQVQHKRFPFNTEFCSLFKMEIRLERHVLMLFPEHLRLSFASRPVPMENPTENFWKT